MQNHHLETWLSKDEYAQIEVEDDLVIDDDDDLDLIDRTDQYKYKIITVIYDT